MTSKMTCNCLAQRELQKKCNKNKHLHVFLKQIKTYKKTIFKEGGEVEATMNNSIGQCAICLEEPAQLVKWANDDCTHSFCADCTRRMLEEHAPLCPMCRRPHRPWVQPFVRNQSPSLLRDLRLIIKLTVNSVMTTITQVWRFTQTNSPMQFVWWVITIWAALYASAAYSAIMCNAYDLPKILHFYDANQTLVFSWNITIVKQAIVYCREHTMVADVVCKMITK